MDRYTRKDAERCFKDIASVLNKQAGNCWERKDGKNVAKVGCWTLDCNSIYGGCVIEEMMNENGGVVLPFGEGRMNPYNFCRATNFAKIAVKMSKGDSK